MNKLAADLQGHSDAAGGFGMALYWSGRECAETWHQDWVRLRVDSDRVAVLPMAYSSCNEVVLLDCPSFGPPFFGGGKMGRWVQIRVYQVG